MTGRRIAIGVPAAAIGLLLWATTGWAAGCTPGRADAAMAAANRLRDWPGVYSFFKDYRDCDDGGIADATSDAVTRLLARRWDELATLARLAREHADFRSFVLGHVDSTADTDDLERALDQSVKRCPAAHRPLCADVAAAARKALE